MKNLVCKLSALLIATTLIISSSTIPVNGAEKQINYTALNLGINKALSNDQILSIDANNKSVTPFIKNNRTLIPLRFVSESFGSKVIWNEVDKSISIDNQKNSISFIIGQNTMTINGAQHSIDVAPEIFLDRTYIPLRAFSEAMGNNILWDERGLIIITDKNTLLDQQTDKEFIDQIYTKLDKERLRVKGLYLTSWAASSDENLEHYIDMAKKAEINTFVIDIKDTDGLVNYQGNLEALSKNNAYSPFYNVKTLIKKLHENNIYIIGRVSCFEDSILADKEDLVLKSEKGDIWKSLAGQPALDPSNKAIWEYILNITKESLNFGFDEIQLDYVKFEEDSINTSNYKISSNSKKHEIINEFLGYLKSNVPYAKIGLNIYGSTCQNESEKNNSGQDLETLITNVYSVSPVLYPGYFPISTTINGVDFNKPDLYPYDVVKNALLQTNNRLKSVIGRKAVIRPYLQAFTAKWLGTGYYQEYTLEHVKQQIKAVYDAGYDEWILWDSSNEYFGNLQLK